MQTKIGNGNRASLEQLMEDLKVVVRDGEELLKAGVSTVRERAIISARRTDRAVREYPYQSVAVVFGLGVLTGLLAIGMCRGEPEMEEEEQEA